MSPEMALVVARCGCIAPIFPGPARGRFSCLSTDPIRLAGTARARGFRLAEWGVRPRAVVILTSIQEAVSFMSPDLRESDKSFARFGAKSES